MAPPPTLDGALRFGTGLCGAFKQCVGDARAVFPSRTTMWPSDAALFPAKVNELMELRGAPHGPRIDETLLQSFDLTNSDVPFPARRAAR